MRLVVADTTPVNYLILIGAVGILESIFERVFLPAAVRDELRHSEAPEAVRSWANALPMWIEVVALAANRHDPALNRLDEGERAAIELAQHIGADLILMDDREGVAIARKRGFVVTGTLGMLDMAARRGLLDIGQAVDGLRGTNFRCRPELLSELLARHSQPGSRGV